MGTGQTAPKDIDEYIARFPDDVRETLEKIRMTIRKAAADAQETISYQIPTFTLSGKLVHFAAFKNHIGFYPGPSGIEKRMSYLFMTAQKVRCSFHWISQFLFA